MSITVQHLSRHYGSQKAVNNISFSVNKGEIVGFLGPNGAGKSTTMKMITGYIQPDNGHIEVCGIPVSENDISTKKKIRLSAESLIDWASRDLNPDPCGLDPKSRKNDKITFSELFPIFLKLKYQSGL